jgi:acetyl-CoA carboxylase biotin carboxylase subunit
VLGVRTNIPFLIALLEHPRFIAAAIDTGFLDREIEAVREQLDANLPAAALAAVAAHRPARDPAAATPHGGSSAADPFVSLGGWRSR